MKQIQLNNIKESQRTIIYPIYENQNICLDMIEFLQYDIHKIICKEYNQITKIYTLGKMNCESILFIGLGKEDEMTTQKLRKAFETVSKEVKEDMNIFIHSASTKHIDVHQVTRLFVETYLLSTYQERVIGHQIKEIHDIDIIENNENIHDDIIVACSYARGINHARELADTPSNLMTPETLVEEAKKLAEKYDIECQILNKNDLEEMRAGGILAVNQGSHIPAYMICLKYSHSDTPYRAVIGKGITFDSGGYNLKGNSLGMKYDMCGAADVLGIMEILAATHAKTNVYGIIPTTENLVSDQAYKPQDVITTLSGQTVEIISTDAEGRLILCDALTYAQQLGVTHMIDLATLTGACVSALGDVYTGVFSNDDEFYKQFEESLKVSDEKGWRLPMDEEYFKKLKSSSADMKNSVGKPGGGASVAANFLNAFVSEDVKWIHLDIAGTADHNGTKATGAMIRSVVNVLKEQ